MMRNGAETEPGGWTRRGTLAALAAVVAAPALPSAAGAAALPTPLVEICVAAAAAPLPARLGAAAVRGRSLPEIAASLRGRLGDVGAGDWRGALVRSGRRDIAAGDTIEVLGRPLMRTEAEVLALGSLLRAAA